jgi:hypothetical protein
MPEFIRNLGVAEGTSYQIALFRLAEGVFAAYRTDHCICIYSMHEDMSHPEFFWHRATGSVEATIELVLREIGYRGINGLAIADQLTRMRRRYGGPKWLRTVNRGGIVTFDMRDSPAWPHEIPSYMWRFEPRDYPVKPRLSLMRGHTVAGPVGKLP